AECKYPRSVWSRPDCRRKIIGTVGGAELSNIGESSLPEPRFVDLRGRIHPASIPSFGARFSVREYNRGFQGVESVGRAPGTRAYCKRCGRLVALLGKKGERRSEEHTSELQSRENLV